MIKIEKGWIKKEEMIQRIENQEGNQRKKKHK